MNPILLGTCAGFVKAAGLNTQRQLDAQQQELAEQFRMARAMPSVSAVSGAALGGGVGALGGSAAGLLVQGLRRLIARDEDKDKIRYGNGALLGGIAGASLGGLGGAGFGADVGARKRDEMVWNMLPALGLNSAQRTLENTPLGWLSD